MIISSPAFNNNEPIPVKYACDGENVNPPLEIKDVPQPARSLVLIVEDPDAPGGTWIHWVLWNVNPKTKKIDENSVPQGATEGQTSFGKPGYGGPCPPSGTHRYFFKLYALGEEIDLPPDATINELKKDGMGHIYDTAQLIGFYGHD
jgi:Raf kinase inhibitor-like YbhB/YbcL family protein